MIKFKQYLEEASGKNLHMTHLEDAVIDGGVKGTRNVINYLRALRDMLSGSASAPMTITVKWDGAPAIFAGIDPSDGKFFVAKKGVFNKTPKIYKTNAEIDNDLSGDLNSKFKVALAELSKLGISEGVIQGDFLYTSEDLQTETIDGESYITFHPNTIVYAIPAKSDLAKQINRSKIGVVWHTTYRGSDFESMQASFGKAIVPSLQTTPSVWAVDATFEDRAGTATFTGTETAEFTELLAQAGRLFRTINAKVLNSLSADPLNARLNVFINKKVREGSRIGDAAGFVIELQRELEEYYQAQIDSKKSQRGKDAQIKNRDAALKIFTKRNLRELEKVFTLYNLLVDAKHIVIGKLNTVEGLTTLLKTKTGFVATGQEGFVAIDHLGKNSLKLVDRLEFSKANFSTEYIKGWQK
jgi:hypothetical protein